MSRRILTLVDAFSQKAFIIMSIGKCIFKLQFKARSPNFHVELILLHSPLLKESCLVSPPPLTYMLKFSGFSCLTSGLDQGRSAPDDWCKLIQLLMHSNNREHRGKPTVSQCFVLQCARTYALCVSKRVLTHPHSALRREAEQQRQDMALIQACLQEDPENIEYVQCPIGSRNSAIHNA